MKTIFLIFLLLSSLLFSAAPECKTDIYFSNGILTKDWQAQDTADNIELAIIKKFGMDYYNKNIGEVEYAYNTTLLSVQQKIYMNHTYNF